MAGSNKNQNEVRRLGSLSGIEPVRTFTEIARKLRIERSTVVIDYLRAMGKLRRSPECRELLDFCNE